MNTDAKTQTTKVLSEAKLRANRANAQHSPGPRNTSSTRLNARKHGLFGQLPLPGRDVVKDDQFFAEARVRLGPKNPMEEARVEELLQARLEQKLLLEIEHTFFTRRPVMAPKYKGPYPFLVDPDAVKTLDALSRRLAHLTQLASKTFSELLRVRQEPWAQAPEAESQSEAEPTESSPPHSTDSSPLQDSSPTTADSEPPPGTFLACLAEPNLFLPGEDFPAFAAGAGRVWATFAPTNTPEGFLATDFIELKWRLERVLRMQRQVFEQAAISATEQDCGFGFAFIHDSQRHAVLETLGRYESALRKANEKTMTLWRKVRKQGWQDAALCDTDRPQSPPADIPSDSPTPISVPASKPLHYPEAAAPAFPSTPFNSQPAPAPTPSPPIQNAAGHG